MVTRITHSDEQNAWQLLLDAVARLSAADRSHAIRDLQQALGTADMRAANLLLDLVGKAPGAARAPSGPAPPAYVAMLATLLRRAIERSPSL